MRRWAWVACALLVGTTLHADPGNCLRFFGTAGTSSFDLVRVRMGDPQNAADIGAEDFTIEWWMRCTTGNNETGVTAGANYSWINGNIIWDRDSLGGNEFGDFGISLDGEALAFGVENGAASQRTLIGATDVCTGSWVHVAFTRQRSSGDLAIYVGGTRDAVFAGGPGGDLSYDDTRGSPSTWDPYFALGGEKHALGVPGYTGYIDEMRLSNSLRYTGTSYTIPTTPFTVDANTLALYHMNEGTGTTMGDDDESADGTLTVGGPNNAPQWAVSDAPLGSADGRFRLPRVRGGDE